MLGTSFRKTSYHITNPLPRAETIPGHRFATEPQSDGFRDGQCQDGGQVGPVQVTWTAGEEVTVQFMISANHGGWHELRFCPDPFGNNTCYEQHLALAVNPTVIEGCPEWAPSGSTHASSCIPSGAENREDLPTGSGLFSSRFIVPRDLQCDHCGLQWWWVTNNGGREHFKSCHDVEVLAGAPTLPPAPTPAPAPTSLPPPCSLNGQQCNIDGSGQQCCPMAECQGTANWATCANIA